MQFTEFFEKDDALLARSGVRAYPYWWRTGVNQGSSIVTSEYSPWTFSFSNKVSIKWDRVGVTEGPVISD